MRHFVLAIAVSLFAQALLAANRLPAQEVKEITPSVANYGLPATHSGITAARKGFSKVELFDGANLVEVFDNDGREISEVHTNRAIVVWAAKDIQDVFQVWVLDAAQPLGASNPRAITATSYDNTLPQVWRTAAPSCADPDPQYFVAWRGEATQNDADIFYFDSAAAPPGITQIAKAGDDAIKFEPSINFPNSNLLDIEDSIIVWQGVDLDPLHGSATGDFDVYRYTLPPTVTLANISDPLDSTPTFIDHDWDPQTSAGYVVFHHDGHESTGTARSEIRSFDPAVGSAHLLQTDLNGTPNKEPDSLYRPMVHGLNVTWVNGSQNFGLAITELWGSRADGVIPAPGIRMTNNGFRIDGYPFVQDDVIAWNAKQDGFANWKVYRIFYDFTGSKCPSFTEEVAMLPGAVASYLIHEPVGGGVLALSSDVEVAASDGDSIVCRKKVGTNSSQLTQYFPASLAVTNPSGRDVQFQITSSSWQDSPLPSLQAICRVFVSSRGGAVYTTTGYLGTGFCNDPLTGDGVVVNFPDNKPILGPGDCSGRRMSLVGAVDPVDLPDFVDPLYLWSVDVNQGDGIQAPMGSFNCSTGRVASALTPGVDIFVDNFKGFLGLRRHGATP